MKRLLYIMFACACAMFAFVSNAEAQTTGDIVTISYKSGNTTNYLAVNDAGTAIQNRTAPNEYCYWRVTVSGNTYTFESVTADNKFLNISNKDNNNITLGNSQDITRNGNKLYRRPGNKSYYVRYNSGWKSSTTSQDLTITTFTRDFLTVTPTPYDGTELTELEKLTTITLTAKEGVVIDDSNLTNRTFTLTDPTDASASISSVTANGNVLTITVANGDSEGTYTLNILNGAVKDQYGISFAAAEYSWKVSAPYHKFTSVKPAEGVTQAFNSITLTTDVEMADLEFDAYHPDNNKKIKFTHTATNGTVTTLYVLQGLAVKFGDNRQTLIITIDGEYGDGTYMLDIAQGAVKGKTDGLDFQKKTYEWTVNKHRFANVTPDPDSFTVGNSLGDITVTATDNVPMTILYPDLIKLTDAGGKKISISPVVNANNQLVIPLNPALGNGTYKLTIEDGAVVGPNRVAFTGITRIWNVVVSVAITHVKGFYPALGAGGYQNVHTVERTIYYDNTTTSIPLTLAETNFFGYMRWYDYTTDKGTNINWDTPPSGRGGEFEELVGTTTHLGWFGWNSNTTDGVLTQGDGSNKTPEINTTGWTGNRTIACDVSAYTDYTITRVDNNIVGITEPRLSYRQLFHFRPASDMAAQVDACTGDTYLETYYYTAPTNTNVYLTTAYHHSMPDATENNYFYNKTNPTRIPASNLSWYKDGDEIDDNYVKENNQWGGSSSTILQDFQTVSSESPDTVTYYLKAKIGTETYNIAKFVVNYVDKNTYGPVKETSTNGSAKAIRSYNEMNNLFEVLEYNNFNYGQKSDQNENYLTTPLPYIESTYGFYYNAPDAIKPNTNIPYYGEYSLVNRLNNNNQSWAKGANHVDGITDDDTAGRQGYAMYVDGTTEPGVVASISTQVTICAERTMYCSVWLRNPGSSNSKPIFRCNVQGRNRNSDGTYTPWENVSTYFAGDLGYTSGWNQVNIPIVSQETYSECRVQIYNFGTGVSGNDFYLDDLCIYADKLPMSSYQLQTEMCCSPDHDGTTFTAAVLRVDYRATTISSTDYQYYQIYNKTTGKPFVLTSTSLSPYYDEHSDYQAPNLTKEQYGSIEIMAADYIPSEAEIRNNPSELVGELLNAYHLDTNDPKTAPLCGKCFVAKKDGEVTTESPGEYYMYVVHIIPNIHDNRVQENYLQEHCQYTLRMTSEASDLLRDTLSCAIEIDLPATQESLYRLMSSQIETSEFLCNSANNCPNELYTIEAFIRKDSDPYSDAGKAEGTYLADWMYGHAFDDVYRMDYPHENDSLEHLAKDTADLEFAEVYHCSRAQVTNAFLDLRRVPTPAIDTIPADPNPNYYAKTFGEISPLYFSDYRQDADTPSVHYETIKYLHEQGWLQLATSSASFYLGSQDTARYWVFPIENSAKAEDGVTPLHDCPEPRWVQVSSTHSNHYINIAPGIDIASSQVSDPRTGVRVPNVRVLARMVNNTIQIPIHQSSQGDYDVHFMGADASIFVTNDDKITDPHEVKYTSARSGNVITLLPAAGNNATLEIGKEYTMSIRMRDNMDQHRAAGETCDVGKVYVKLLILPDIVQWTPTTPDKSWHNDANWTGYGTGMENYHYAPIAGSGVIIPSATQRSEVTTPELTVIANTDPHPYPLDANFALTPTCGQIYFQPGAMMLNQHLLQHDKALVDLIVPNQTWNTVAVPIASIVSGDMYIPHIGDEKNGDIIQEPDPFTVGSFQGSRLSTSAFPFWISVYNKTVQRVNANPDKTGTTISTNTKVFASTNALDEPMQVGSGYQLLGYGPSNFGAGDSLTIRLPKPDISYSYYYKDGSLGQNVAINRGANPNKLIYSPDVPITLTNERTSNSFMFGNPTMAMIDLTKCLPDGATIYKMVNDSWGSGTKVSLEMDEAYRYLEPMRSVLVTLPTAGTTAQIDLQAEDLTTPEKIAAAKGNNIAPRRNASGNTLQLMTIYADVYGTKARCLVGAKSGMADTYALGEDALFISSGVEAEVNSATATSPVNMYTVSDNIPLMVDIRENIDTIPMALLIQDYYRTDKFTLTFHLTENWEKECYFCDALTGSKTLITDSLTLEVDMPLNHATRYFITGPDRTTNSGVVTNTTNPNVAPLQVWAYSEQAGEITVRSNDIIQSVTVYDIAGHIIARQTLDLLYNQVSLPVGQGIHIAEVTLRDNSKHYTRTIVK